MKNSFIRKVETTPVQDYMKSESEIQNEEDLLYLISEGIPRVPEAVSLDTEVQNPLDEMETFKEVMNKPVPNFKNRILIVDDQ